MAIQLTQINMNTKKQPNSRKRGKDAVILLLATKTVLKKRRKKEEKERAKKKKSRIRVQEIS